MKAVKPDVCVVGSLNMDLVVRVPRQPAPGETIIGTAFDTALGGKGFNQAVAAARSGASVAMVGRVGNDPYGDELLAALAAEGIDATHVTRDDVDGTGIAVPIVDASGANSIVVVRRANDRVSTSDVERAAPAIEAASVLLLQCEIRASTIAAAAKVARDADTTVVLNVAPAETTTAAFARLVDLVVVNEVEAETLTGIVCDGDGIAAAARKLKVDSGAKGVVLTLGERGAFVDDGQPRLLSAHQSNCVDTVGAGDAFCGAFVSALTRGATIVEAVRHGNAAGALAVGAAGAASSMPTRSAIEALLGGKPVV